MYVRKSSESEDRQVQSIDDQIACLRRLAASLGLHIKEVYTEAKSAKKPFIRPLFAEMLKRIEQGEANGILVWHINRLSRNPVDSGTLGWMLQQGVIRSIQTMEKQYLPEDNVILFSVESSMANQYIIELRKACMRGMDRKASLGWKPGMAVPGYMNDKENKIIVPDPERFQMVRQMWDLMLTGNYSPQRIRILANEEWGFRTRRYKSKGGVKMPMWGIYTMFSNIFYAGMFRWKGVLYHGNHTPMITLEEFEKVQSLLGNKSSIRPQQNIFAYTGLIRCNSCNMMFTATEKRKTMATTGELRKYVYYHCSRKSPVLKCNNSPVGLSELERLFELELEKFTISPEFLEFALSHLDEMTKDAISDATAVRENQQKALQLVEKELENLTRMRYRDLIDDDTFRKESIQLKDHIVKLKHQLSQTSDTSGTWHTLARTAFIFAAYARKAFNEGDVETRRSIVAAFGSNYRIEHKKLLFEKVFWLLPLQKAYEGFIAEFRRLELHKTLDTEAWNSIFHPTILLVCAGIQAVRKVIEENNDTTLYIPDLTGVSTVEAIHNSKQGGGS